MPVLKGRITRMHVYEEEGRTDWALALSKILWFVICALFPLSLFRFISDLFGAPVAVVSIAALLLLIRLLGPQNFVFLDEFLSRIVPSLRSAIRFGRVRVYDFRIQQEDGRRISCILKGDLRGGAPMTRDEVTLEGSFRGGTFRVREGRNDTTTQSLIATRSGHSGWILISTLALVILFYLYLWGSFDRWIYPWVADLLDFLSKSI